MSANKPSPTATNGKNHATDGRFTSGNKAAKGNPHAKRAGQLRSAMLKAVTPEAVRKTIDALSKEAASGNVQAAKELLDRSVGKPTEADLIERLEVIETQLKEKP